MIFSQHLVAQYLHLSSLALGQSEQVVGLLVHLLQRLDQESPEQVVDSPLLSLSLTCSVSSHRYHNTTTS